MKEISAVEWLSEQIFNDVDLKDSILKLAIQQAKEMEKIQIKNAWLNSLTKGDFNSADEYYNETFKQQENETDSI